MRKISNGFTMIELLLTMGIIGIVAALTIPGLVSKFSNAHFGATLGSTAQRIELGLRNLIDTANKNYAANGESTTDLLTTIKTKDILTTSESEDYIITDDNNGRALFETLGAVTGILPFRNDDGDIYDLNNSEGETLVGYLNSVKAFDGGDRTADIVDESMQIYQPEKTNSILIPHIDISSLDENKIRTDTLIGYIYVDINWNAKPNREGQDIFLFGLTAGGTLVPAGTDVFNNGIEDLGLSLSIPTAEEGCVNGSVTNGLSCTARVVKEEWKLNYMK